MTHDQPSPPRRFFHELRRRRVLRTAALYIVGGWVMMQVADVTFPALDVPERALRYVLFAVLAGFPAALVFGWFYDITPGGIRRTPQAGPAEASGSEPLRTGDYVVLTALVCVVGAIVYNTIGSVVQEPVDQARAPSVERSGPPVVAVLPFTTTSREGDNQFFATGVHDDLLTRLSKLQSLRVISRTSVMEYQDVARNLREIGSVLGADVIMEGGVQIAGDQIRINAQLIDARSDEHLWAHTYDRELNASNIFKVQSEIARAISSAMHTTLTPQDADQLALIPTENMAAYRAYRRAMDIAESESIYQNPDYLAALEEAVELDPGFTRAWAELGGHLTYINFWGEPRQDQIERAEEILGILSDLAPNSADYLIALAYYNFYTLKDYDLAFETIIRAEEKAPSDLKILAMKTWILRRQGRHAERNQVFRDILLLDPKDGRTAAGLVSNLMVVHEYEEASEYLLSTPFDGLGIMTLRAVDALRHHGDYDRYANEVIDLVREFSNGASSMDLWESLIHARQFDAAESMLETLKSQAPDDYPGLDENLTSRLITYWFLGKNQEFDQAVEDARAHLIKFNTDELAVNTTSLLLDLAILPSLTGEVEESVRLTRQWRRITETGDATEYVTSLRYACRSVAMVGAIEEAVDCVRKGVTEPSWMIRHEEPYLPYYDSIRESPEFKALLAELNLKN